MREILEKLNGEVGIRGSLILTRDGIVVQSVLATTGLDEDRVAAIAGEAFIRMRRALERAGVGGLDRFLVTASFGRMIFTDVGRAVLVVVADRLIDIEMALLAISHAAYKLRG